MLTKSPLSAIATPTGWHSDHEGNHCTFKSERQAEAYMKMQGITGVIRDYGYLVSVGPIPETMTTGDILEGMFGRPKAQYTRALHEMIIGT
jgi:hypothetical protein